ncbi:MAG: peptide chain release factor N(5)-glutamine methyltransferase [Candidatus Cloacimonetes bacterium]|jgi:release factor glutamine methyltransferase|nr:peptide chain release factor N(5)-glutamine methyltransferase [Candidatus Cloacimonadota bacterium]MDY0299123.1 peptide chain release factor N(5)-glutamine methyltransferase [Candidatus Cloacimonadaceae bacterium]MCB5278161.1 peptide chain release factor N(5)-glutamine methyltransferase [Candidatus Cloacimonadota bacterium]MCK9333174.1 peptide chain release factor N(5)-glutamine methyltransferase [Candidatus Cloacimonadota bacterium]MDD2210456.1 peptide chain release factor N(5)-glutamine me
MLDGLRKEFPEVSEADFSFLLCSLLQCSVAELPFQETLSDDDLAILRKWLIRLQTGEPPQYIVHKAWFYGLELYVDERVLIPRFDTEVLVQALLTYLNPSDTVLEIGVGSGAISIALKHNMPSLDIVATDIDPDALEVARYNINKQNFDIHLERTDLYPLQQTKFRAILSNPPYISEIEYDALDDRVKQNEPIKALKAGANGLEYYMRILAKAPQYLCNEGILAFEHGYNQQSALLSLTESAGFKTLQKGKDLAGLDRFLIVQYK